MSAKVSEKNTKSQILTAYQAALQEIKNLKKKSPDRKTDLKLVKEKETVQQAIGSSIETILDSLRQTRKSSNEAMLGLESDIVSKKETLDGIVESIKILQNEIEQLTEIKTESDTLIALQKAHKDAIEAFEEEQKERKAKAQKEMQENANLWTEEQNRRQKERDERDAEFKKNYARKLEQHKYDFDMRVKQDQDEFDQQKREQERQLEDSRAKVEAELDKREEIVAAKEEELAKLRIKADLAPKEKEEAVKEAVEAAVKREKSRHGYEVSALKKDHEVATAVITQHNLDLKERNQELNNRIIDNEKTIKELITKNENIANSAIAGASKTVFVQGESGKTVTK